MSFLVHYLSGLMASNITQCRWSLSANKYHEADCHLCSVEIEPNNFIMLARHRNALKIFFLDFKIKAV